MADDHEDYETGAAPAAHGPSHEAGESDEFSVAGLSGVTEALLAHSLIATAHQDAPGLIETHRLVAAAHHARYTDLEAEAVADAQIATHALVATAHQDAPALIAAHAANSSLHHVNYTAVHAYLSVGQDLVSGVITLISFDLERYDTQNEFNTTTHIFTAKTAGKYLVTLNAHLNETIGLGHEFTAWIMIEGNYVAAQRSIEGGTVISGRCLSVVWDLSVDSEVKFYCKVVYTENRKLAVLYTRATITRLL